MIVAELDTPFLLIDLDRLEANITRMAAIARANGVALRPHAKTHKLPPIAHKQLAAGSPGLTVAKLGEAEVFADHGIEDFFIAYPLWGETKWERLCRLAERARVRVAADSYEVLEGISRVAARHGRRIPYRLELDSGMGRAGIQTYEEALAIARRAERLPGVELVGLMGYAGHAGDQPDLEGIRQVGLAEGHHLVAAAEFFRAHDFAVPELTVGGTPTGKHAATVAGITEIRPGTYVFSDRNQVTNGWGDLDGCALRVRVTVVSRPTATRAIIDAGAKTLSSDAAIRGTGHGAFVGHPEFSLNRLSEEHGIMTVPAGADLPIGSRLELIPNHACVCLNLHNQVAAIRGDTVEEIWEVAARGKVR
ncbi:MAG TPA: alanine racemase [Chloroflexota bacterium]|nr:alanine racemase [Chloroflexota bacterium]